MIGSLIKSLFGGSESEVEIPDWMGEILSSEDDLLKGAGHKYIRRIPTGNPKKPWKYFYKVSGGSGLGHHSEFVEGAAFKVAHNGKEGHFHILGVDGDRLRIKHDETGEESTLTKDALTSLLHKEHAKAIGEHKERLKKELVAVSKHGSEKQKAKIQSEANKAGVYEDRTTAPHPEGSVEERVASAAGHKRGSRSGITVKGSDVFLGTERGRPWRFKVMGSPEEAEALANAAHYFTGNIKAREDIKPGSDQYKGLTWLIENHKAFVDAVVDGVKQTRANRVKTTDDPSERNAIREILDSLPKKPNPTFASVGRVSNKEQAAINRWILRNPEHPRHEEMLNETIEGVQYQEKKEDLERAFLDDLRKVVPGTPKTAFKDAPKPVSSARLKSFASKDVSRPHWAEPFNLPGGLAGATDGHRAIVAPSDQTLSGKDPGLSKMMQYIDAPTTATVDVDLLRPIMDMAKSASKLQNHVGDASIVPAVIFRASGDTLEAGIQGSDRWFPVGTTDYASSGLRDGIAVNSNYLQDAIKGAKVVKLGSPKSSLDPLAIHRENGEKHIIMPMRR